METILVTGSAGFIGSHLCEKLLELGYGVICIDNFDDYYDPKVKEKNLKVCLKDPRFKLDITDVGDFHELEKIFEKNKISKIVHLAAKAGVRASLKNPEKYREVNVNGTLNLLELARKFNIKKFIFGSSSSVYGTNKKIPFSEKDQTDNITSPYAETKRTAEIFCSYYHKMFKMNIICLRYFTVYGPRGRPDMAPYKFTKLIASGEEVPVYGDGGSKRDYTYVSDVVDGIVRALDKNLGFEIINLGNSKAVELRYLISLIEDNLGKKAKIKQLPIQAGDVPITYADIKKAKKLLGWEPKIKIEEGIKRLVKWYNEQ